ncbi:hypothetical protein B0H13DRAFT_2110829 [Mycena leptocephala]|nr:hypothetical protein B0H13DRAFT_2110829 [Mycena leptocephala]
MLHISISLISLHPRVRDPALQEDERVGVAALRPSPPSIAQGHRASDVPRLFIRRTAPPPLRALCLHSTSRAPPPLMSQPSSTVSTSPLSPPTQFTMRAPGLCAALASTTMIRVPAIVLCPPRVSLTRFDRPRSTHAWPHRTSPASPSQPRHAPTLDPHIPLPPNVDAQHPRHVQRRRHAFLVSRVTAVSAPRALRPFRGMYLLRSAPSDPRLRSVNAGGKKTWSAFSRSTRDMPPSLARFRL